MKYLRANGKFAEYKHTLTLRDLQKLDDYLASATAVVPLREIARGNNDQGVVGMRHDVDHNLEYAVRFAEWEAERGYCATYFVLHTAWYYDDKQALYAGMERLVDLGHEIGLHSNATVIAAGDMAARYRWETPAQRLSVAVSARIADILNEELSDLRCAGFEITGMAAHGDIACYEMGVYNDLRFTKLTLDQFGLEYDADRLRRGCRQITDNHGAIHGSMLQRDDRQVSMLLHPCHWELPSRSKAPAA